MKRVRYANVMVWHAAHRTFRAAAAAEVPMQHSEFLLNQRHGVVSARGAKRWLRDLPLSDARSAHHTVSAMLGELADSPMSAFARLEILETVRSTIAEIDQQYAARYADKPLPLGLPERNAFTHAQVMWRRLAAMYLQCFEASLAGEPALARHRALCLARAGGYFCDALAGRFRGGQADDPDLIGDLQQLVDLAAENSVLDVPVRDSLHPRGGTSVAQVYRRALLIALAGNCLQARERQAMFDLARLWEGKTAYTALAAGVQRELRQDDLPPAAPGGRQSLRAVRLGRWLHLVDVTALSLSLRRRIRKLDAGAAVEDARLPASFQGIAARDVLGRLHAAWCEGGDLRGQVRAAALVRRSQAVALGFAGNDFEAMFCLVDGRPFILNDSGDPSDRRRYDELFVFQHAPSARSEMRARESARQFEDWEVIDESTAGFRLHRARAGARFRVGQVVALRLRLAGDDGPVVLAQVRWLTEPDPALQSHAGALEAGVELLKGKPHGVGIRQVGGHLPRHNPFVAAFRLGSLHGEDSVSLVVPGGWFKPERSFEMRDAGLAYRLRMVRVASRGHDFELVEAILEG
jgi:hypothetical protein